MKKLFLALALSAPLFGQATVYIRAGGPPAVAISGVTNATPMVVTATSAHGLSTGDLVTIYGVCGATAANGIRKITFVDSTHVSLANIDGSTLAGNGDWCSGGTASSGANAQVMSKVTAYTTTDLPRGYLDGSNGTLTRKLALGTHNGLTSIVVSSNVATVTTSYAHGIVVGDKVSVWGTTDSTNLNKAGSPYTVTGATTYTFTFATASVSPGNYETNNACGPSGTANCVRISQLAYTGNVWWDGLVSLTNPYATGINYKFKFHGGTQEGSTSAINYGSYFAQAATRFFVDQQNTQMRDVALYAIKQVEAINGVNWTGRDGATLFGNSILNDYSSYMQMYFGHTYQIIRDYLSSGEKTEFLNKIYNDWNDPSVTACTSPSATNQTLATGTAQAGSSNTITLAAGDAAADNYYVNNVIKITVGTATYFGVVSGYVSATKVATITGTWGAGSPTTGTAYSIYATITRSGTTITGYNTTFTSQFVAGDAVMGLNNWPSTIYVQTLQSYISSVDSDTSLTVINGSAVSASATPTIMWIEKKWKSSDCGLLWAQKFWALVGSQPSMYPPAGGAQTSYTALNGLGIVPHEASNNGGTAALGHMALDLILAEDDPRAVKDLAITQTYWLEHQLGFDMNYMTGTAVSGAYYSWHRPMAEQPLAAAVLQRSVPTFPSMDLTGNWIKGLTLFKMYDILPEKRWNGSSDNMWPSRFGSVAYDVQLSPGALVMSGFVSDGGMYLNPNSDASKYLKNFLSVNASPWRYGLTDQPSYLKSFLNLDPRYPSADYTVQPYQRLFQATSHDTCITLTGRTCQATMRGDMVISRTGWSSQEDTHIQLGARSFLRDHDIATGGSARVYKAGHLLTTDDPSAGNLDESMDSTKRDNLFEFGGLNTLQQGPPYGGSIAYFARWDGSHSGTWESAYGDQSSRYAYAMADLSGMYATVYNRVNRHWVHFKQAGTQEILIQFDDVDTSNSPIPIRTQFHYGQNSAAAIATGTAQAGTSNTITLAAGDAASSYASTSIVVTIAGAKYIGRESAYNSTTKVYTVNANWPVNPGAGDTYEIYAVVGPDWMVEGSTTCPGPNGCAGLDTDRWMQTVENGARRPHSTVVANYGLASKFLSPGTIYVRSDGSTYPGAAAAGNTHRVSLCAISCGGTSTSSVAIGSSGTKTFVTQAGLPFAPGDKVRAVLTNNTYYIDGTVSTYSGTSLSITATGSAGTGTFATWTIIPYASGMEALTVHRIGTIGDLAVTATAIAPDANWYGVQTADKVALFSRGGQLRTGVTFTTNHSGTAQYLIAGLAQGAYNVTVGGSAVAGSPFNVVDGNNSIYLESTSGVVSVSQGDPVLTITTGSLANGAVGVAYSQTINYVNNTGSVTFSLLSGTLPAGLTLSAGGTLSGTPTTANTYSFSVQAVDTLTTTSASYSVTITVLSIATASPLPDGVQSTAYSQTLAASGGTPAYTWSLTAGSLPTGITLGAAGLVSGTTSSTGTFTFQATVTDSLTATASASFSLTIQSSTPDCTIPTASVPNGIIGGAYSAQIQHTCVSPVVYSVTAGALCDCLYLDPSQGTVSGIPTTGQTCSFTVGVIDAASRSAIQAYSITVPPTVDWRYGGPFASTSAIYLYQAPSAAGCTITLSGGATATELASNERRKTVQFSGMTPFAQYSWVTVCSTGSVGGSFTTAATPAAVTRAETVSAQAPSSAVDNLIVEYGPTSGLGSAANAACNPAARCSLSISASNDQVLYVRRRWCKNRATDQTCATGSNEISRSSIEAIAVK